MNKSSVVAVENVAVSNESKTGKQVAFPKIQMRFLHRDLPDVRANTPADGIAMRQILTMANKIAIKNRQKATDTIRGGVEYLTLGTITSECYCSTLYPYHRYTFDASVYNDVAEMVDQFDFEVRLYLTSGKKRKAARIKSRYLELGNRHEEIIKSLDNNSPDYDELSGNHGRAEIEYQDLIRIEMKSEEMGYLHEGDLEEYNDIISRFEEQMDKFEEALKIHEVAK